MACLVLCSLQLTTTNLRRIAVALKASGEERSNDRRIRRFLAGYDLDAVQLGRLLVHLARVSPPSFITVDRITVDRTEWQVGSEPVNVLAAGMSLEGEVVLPIAWVALPKEGGSSADEQMQVLNRLHQVVDAGQIAAVVTDREFISVPCLTRLKAVEVSIAARVRSDRRGQRSPGGTCLPVRMIARTASPGCPRILEAARLQGEDGTVTTGLVIRRIGDADGGDAGAADAEAENPFLTLALWEVESRAALASYAERWSIETLFAALAFLWVRLVGERRAETEGPHCRLPHGRRCWSLFRYGLIRLPHLLATPEETRRPLFRCLQFLRSPAVFLSCTEDQPPT